MRAFNLKETLELARQARVGDAEARRELCERLGVKFVERLPLIQVPPELIKTLDVAWARKNRLVPVQAADDHVVVAVSSPLALDPLDELAFVWRTRIETLVAPEEEILQALNQISSAHMDTADELIMEMETDEDFSAAALEALPDLIDSDEAAPIIKLVNRMLMQAVSEQASDIHIEPGPQFVKVRFRIDGILYDRISPPGQYMPFLSSRIKVMSGLNIAEKRLPQDGRFQFRVAERSIDVRVSVIPISGGERLVLRLLDKGSSLLSLEDLGMGPDNLEIFSRLIARPHGIILATGPTGSGKTTTLYAALSRLNARELNIITIEDPVEYELPRVGQIQVRPNIGLNFAQGLRSVLRHDPDVIMIGEIRDVETAEIAIQAALTGHLVFSTLHTNDAASAVTRLVDMGIEPYLVSSTVAGVEAQRLVRLLCPHCKQPYQPSPETLALAGLETSLLEDVRVFRPVGCAECLRTGYHGRTGIYELLVMDAPLQEALIQSPEANAIRRVARQAGMKTLLNDGMEKVRKGITSIEEVLRVASTI